MSDDYSGSSERPRRSWYQNILPVLALAPSLLLGGYGVVHFCKTMRGARELPKAVASFRTEIGEALSQFGKAYEEFAKQETLYEEAVGKGFKDLEIGVSEVLDREMKSLLGEHVRLFRKVSERFGRLASVMKTIGDAAQGYVEERNRLAGNLEQNLEESK